MNNDWQIMENTLDQQSEKGMKVPIILNIEATYEDGFKNKNPTFVASGYPTILRKNQICHSNIMVVLVKVKTL